MAKREPAIVMVPAPRLPAPSQTLAHLPPAVGGPVAAEEAGRGAAASADGRRGRMLARATAVHGGFVEACGRAQAAYLGTMAEAMAGLARSSGDGAWAQPFTETAARPAHGPAPDDPGASPSPPMTGAPGSGTAGPRTGAAGNPPATRSAAASSKADRPMGRREPMPGEPDVPSAGARGAPTSPAARPDGATPSNAKTAGTGADAPRTSSAGSPPVPEGDAALAAWLEVRGDDLQLDLGRAPWLGDHRPDHGVAVLPMTAAIEIVAASAQALAPGLRVARVRDLSLRSWIVLGEAPLRLRRRTERRPDGSIAVTLLAWREAARAALSRDEVVASGVVELADTHPAPPPDPAPLTAPEPVPDPYESAELFHGPAFQLLRGLRADAGGATAQVDLGASSAPMGVLHPVALDAALQMGAVKRWDDWCGAEVGGGKCLPVRLVDLVLHGPTPRGGPGRIEMRGRGVDGHPRFPVLEFRLLKRERLWACMTVVFVAVPESPLDAFPARERRAHLRDRTHLPGVRVSTARGEGTTLRDEELAAAQWIPRTIEIAYGIEGTQDLTMAVAMREHAAARLKVHPSRIAIHGDEARSDDRPGVVVRLAGKREGQGVTVRSLAR